MKVLFDHPNPFLLAHGGLQTQIEETRKALLGIGIKVEWLRWWDDTQTGNVIHYFGRPTRDYIDFAHAKGMRVVLSELLTGLGSRPKLPREVQRMVIGILRRSSLFNRMGWDSYTSADALLALTPWEARLMKNIFRAPADRVFVIPNGVEDTFFRAPAVPRKGTWLVCTATITERKRVLELAQAAVLGGVPLWIIGKPYSQTDTYYRAFRALVEAHPTNLRYEGAIGDRARLAKVYSESRGFVLISTMESLSLSALEAAACGAPLLLSDLPWARTTFGEQATYVPVTRNYRRIANALYRFFEQASHLTSPTLPLSWRQVAQKLAPIYDTLCPDVDSASSSR